MDEIVKEFLIESNENLNQLDLDLVELEKDHDSSELLSRIFRAFHTTKGVAGFLSFSKLEALTHAAEELLSRLRDRKLVLNSAIASALLSSVDAVRQMLASIESNGTDGEVDYSDLVRSLAALTEGGAQASDDASANDLLAGDLSEGVQLLDEGACGESAEVDEESVSGPVEEGTNDTDVPHTSLASRNGEQAEAQVRIALANSPAPETASPAAPESRPSEERSDGASHAAESTIRVNVHLLDKVMNLVGELVLVRNQILQFSTGLEDSTLAGASQRLNLITTELQEGIMKTRMQPIGNIWNKFPRVVRDLALACGKQVRLEMEGQETELDKTLIEAIRDPLTHIVRNAVDHGIEMPAERIAAGKPAEGRLLLRAFHESGQVIVEVAEDGAGIDLERVTAKAVERGLVSAEQAARMSDNEIIKFIFQPGFSTAPNVTHISGRGVGMDVVKTNIEKIGGTVDVHSRRGEGTTLRVKIPLTLAIIPALVVTCAGERYAIPQVSLIELVRLDADDKAHRVEMVHGGRVYRLRGKLLPLVFLRDVLQIVEKPESATAAAAASDIVVLQVGEQQFGLVVDGVIDTEEIVVKPLGNQLKGMPACAGATIMGDGRVALILDVLGIAQLAGVISELREPARTTDNQETARERRGMQRLLLCKAGSSERLAVPLDLVTRLEEFAQSQIERAAGCPVVQYRDGVLPLVSMAGLIDGAGDVAWEAETVPAVVFDDGARRIGLVVDRILDIVEDQVVAPQRTNHSGLLGSAIVAGRVTDFLDLKAALEAATRAFDAAGGVQGNNAGARILLFDRSAFSRGLVRTYLEMGGHDVLEAATSSEAGEALEKRSVDLVLISTGAGEDASGQVRAHALRKQIPTIGLADDGIDIGAAPKQAQDYDAYHLKSDRAAILESVETLLGRSRQRADLDGSQTSQAQRNHSPAPGTPALENGADASRGRQFTTFYVDGLLFGVDVTKVQEVLRPQPTTRVPLVRPVIQGLINLRGQIVTALDMRRRLSLAERDAQDGRGAMNIVVRSGEEAVSLLVDEIGDVLEVDPQSFECRPDNVDACVKDLILGVYKLKEELLLVLDIDRAVAGGAEAAASR